MPAQNPLAAQVADYYTQRLIAQYRNKPKAQGHIQALLVGGDGAHGLLANALALQVRDGFDLLTAIGAQLDILGKLRGVRRYSNAIDQTKTYLPLVSYDDPSVGTYPGPASYDDAVQPPETYTMTYEDFVVTTIQDGDFRRVIGFLAMVHSCDYSYASLDAIFYTYFGSNVNLKVTGPMTIQYQHLTSDQDGLFEIVNQLGLLPAPAGVAVSVAEVASF